MNKHINLVGLLYLILGAMGVLALVILFLIAMVGAGLAFTEDTHAGLILGSIGMVFLGLNVVATLPDLLIGYGLIKRRS